MRTLLATPVIRTPTCWSPLPGASTRALARAARAADVLVALGGDGTIRTAAAVCARADTCLIPLAGGTMNMLPRALYGDLALARSADPHPRRPGLRAVSGGDAGLGDFFCAAILGRAVPVGGGARGGAAGATCWKRCAGRWTAFRRSAAESLDYRLDDGAAARPRRWR